MAKLILELEVPGDKESILQSLQKYKDYFFPLKGRQDLMVIDPTFFNYAWYDENGEKKGTVINPEQEDLEKIVFRLINVEN